MKVVRLNENDIENLVRKIIKEDNKRSLPWGDLFKVMTGKKLKRQPSSPEETKRLEDEKEVYREKRQPSSETKRLENEKEVYRKKRNEYNNWIKSFKIIELPKNEVLDYKIERNRKVSQTGFFIDPISGIDSFGNDYNVEYGPSKLEYYNEYFGVISSIKNGKVVFKPFEYQPNRDNMEVEEEDETTLMYLIFDENSTSINLKVNDNISITILPRQKQKKDKGNYPEEYWF